MGGAQRPDYQEVTLPLPKNPEICASVAEASSSTVGTADGVGAVAETQLLLYALTQEIRALRSEIAELKEQRANSANEDFYDLIPYVFGKSLRYDIVRGLSACTTLATVAKTVINLMLEYGQWHNDTATKPFCAALLPYISFKTNRDSLYMAFYRKL